MVSAYLGFLTTIFKEKTFKTLYSKTKEVLLD